MEDMDNQNHSVYTSDEMVRWYAAKHELHPPERTWLTELGPEIAGARLLDIGIGAGRTTEHLASLAGTYVGLDYAEPLVAAARRAHPALDLRAGDARDLSAFDDGAFDVVVFSFNGIDTMDHADRLTVLAEVRRVLADGGLFVFSSHNRDHARFNLLPWQGRPRLGRALLRASLSALRHLPRHLRLRRTEVHREDYAIINDDAHDWSLLMYYISVPAQVRQLADAGFTTVRAYALDGRAFDPDGPERSSVWVNYAARRSS